MFQKFLLTLLLIPAISFGYTVVRKDGRPFSGDLVREDEHAIVIEDERGIQVKFRKDQLDLERTRIENSRSASEPRHEVKAEPSKSGEVREIRHGQGQREWAGELISVDFKDIDIRDFFRFIAEISGANLIIDPSVKGSLTLRLKEVPWDQALDLVCRQYGLAYQIEGNVYSVK